MTLFEQQLKKGMVLETIAVNHLLQHNPQNIIIPTHDFKTGVGKGPRMLQYNCKDIILPDIMMVDPMMGQTTFVEVKRKKKTFTLYQHPGRQFAGIEKHKVEDYRHCAKIMNAELYFMIGVDAVRELHYIKDTDFIVHNFNNQYSTCDTYCLELTNATVVDRW